MSTNQNSLIVPFYDRRTGRVSIVMPAYRESEGIARTIEAVADVLVREGIEHELIVIDDGSDDETFRQLRQLTFTRPTLRAVRLSRHFGKEGALLAGLRLARGQAIITMDSDLQHPPALIPGMLRAWREGNSVVNAVKRDRGDESFFQRWSSRAFNALIGRLGGIDMRDATDFKLLDRTALDTILTSFSEKLRFYRGLTRWIGFQQVDIPFDVPPRVAGESVWTGRGRAGLAIGSIIAYTSAPLRLITYIGLLTMLAGFYIGVDAVWSWFHGRSVAGFPTIIFTDLMVNASIMISLGIIGEYIAKIYDEVKSRPSYMIAEICDTERNSAAAHAEQADQVRNR